MHIIKTLEFIVDFFVNLTVRKVAGGILVLAGLYFISKAGVGTSFEDINLLPGIIGIVIGGIGLVIIIYDTTRAKQYSDAETLVKAYKIQEKEQGVKAWHMSDEEKD